MRLAALVLALAAAHAALAESDLPRRKSDLWHVKITSSLMPDMQFHECVERASDDFLSLSSLGEEKDACSKHEVKRQGANVVAESVCKVEGTTATSRAVFTGSFDSAYQGDVKTTYRPALQGISEMTMKLEARWLGAACKPGQKPGDMEVIGLPGKP